MEQKKRRPRGAALLAGFDVVGDVLLLQFLFLVASLPMFTLVPAAIALQRALQRTVFEDRLVVTRAFFKEFSWAWKLLGRISWPAPLVIGLASFAVLFWLSAPGIVGSVALCILVPLCGLVVAGYIALLGVSMDAEDETTRHDLLNQVIKTVLAKPLPLAGCVIALTTCILLFLRIPTLIPLGSGLVPALLAWLLVRKAPSAGGRVSG